MLACNCTCISIAVYLRVCVSLCAFVYACVFVCMCVCVCVYILRVYEFFICVCIGQTSSLSSVRLRMQSSPGGADSHFLRWLTAVLVNNNTKR